ncbi:MAG TPA: redoxin domain-containing protein [Bryobacterales bacterium]|jgi:peroxiredoxin|nr:redoxin domain-containing protein [Bryobacterales bacterium]
MRRAVYAGVLGLALIVFRQESQLAAFPVEEGADRIGAAAPRLALERWVNSSPLEIANLRGRVVLIRWWTDTCPFCAATAPALQKLQTKYGGLGLQVIGVFHPKPAGDWSVERVREGAKRLNMNFPVALDADWKALHRWWLDQRERSATSVSFVIDKRGIIRYVHPGVEFHEAAAGEGPGHDACHAQFHDIEQTIIRLLAEP